MAATGRVAPKPAAPGTDGGVVEEKEGSWFPVMVAGRPLLLDSKEVPDFGKQIGENTGYVIHPEEVLADNFVLLVTGVKKVKTPRILTDLRKILERRETSAGRAKEKE